MNENGHGHVILTKQTKQHVLLKNKQRLVE
jgi:hypothetical protein